MSSAATAEPTVPSTTSQPASQPAISTSAADEQKATPTTAAAAARPVDMSKYGIHDCTCDGCNAKPINGFRYKCTRCKDHDICESCHTQFLAGTLPHANKLNPMVSKDVSAHAFHAYVDGKSFKAIGGGKKNEPAVKKAKTKPNDPCTCNSGKVAPNTQHTHRAAGSGGVEGWVGERFGVCLEDMGIDPIASSLLTKRSTI